MKAIPTRYNGYHFRSRLEARWAVFFDTLGLKWEYETEGYDLGDLGWYLPDFVINTPNEKHMIEIKPTIPTVDELNKLGCVCHGLKQRGSILFGTLNPPRIEPHTFDSKMKCKLREHPTSTGLSHDEFIGCIGGALMIHFANDGILIPDYETFAYTQGGGEFDIWTYYLDAEKSFLKPELLIDDPGDVTTQKPPFRLEGHILTGLTVGYSSNDPKLEFTPVVHKRIYIGSGVTYESPQLLKAYAAARSARFEHGESGAT